MSGAASAGDDRQLARTGWTVLGVCFALNMFGRGLGDMYTVFLLPIERELGWSRSQLTSVYSVYLLVNGCIAPFVGFVFDRLGARWVYAIGLGTIGSAYVLASGLTTLWQFFLFAGGMIGVGVSFTGMACSEPRLIALAYAFEQATKKRTAPLP